MVYLSKIYTRTGDEGYTGLGDGTRVAKDSPRVEAYGEVDELNSAIGVLAVHVGERLRTLLQSIGNDLFDLGADLCVPIRPNEEADSALRITAGQVERLEKAIDELNEKLEPLTSFVLPGGNAAAAFAHLARTVCRRAERRVVALGHVEPINPQAAVYLNRLSDLLFVAARHLNDDGKADVLWQPAKSRYAT